MALTRSLFVEADDCVDDSTLIQLDMAQAKKFLQDLSPGYMTAKTTLRELKRLLAPISSPTLSSAVTPSAFSLPPYPSWTNEDRLLAGHWKTYLKWEEGNPLMLEDQTALQSRILSAYRKAVARMRFFPDITCVFNSLSVLSSDFTNIYICQLVGLSHPNKSWEDGRSYRHTEAGNFIESRIVRAQSLYAPSMFADTNLQSRS